MSISTLASSKVVAKSQMLMSEETAYQQMLDKQREKFSNFDFKSFTNPGDRIMRTVLQRVEEISGRKIFRDYNRHGKYADFLGILRLMAQSKTKWVEFTAEWDINPDAFSAYYKIMGNLPWYNRKTGEIVKTLYPNWDAVEGYVMYMASKLGIVLDYVDFSKFFNEDDFQSWVEEAEQEIEEISGVNVFKEEEEDEF